MVRQLVDLETGEQLTTWDILKEEGAKEVAKKERARTKRENDEFDKFLKNMFGGFYFNFYKRIKKIDDQYLFRYLYLCTFMDYENNLVYRNKLTDERYFTEKDLKSIWKLSERETAYTKKALLENDMILIDDNKKVSVNKRLCKKGTIYTARNIEVIRMFENCIKYLYENSKATDHKKISNIIKLLPYMNFKYNILCEPESKECELLKEIVPLSSKRLYEILGCSLKNGSRVKKDLQSFKTPDDFKVFAEIKIDDFLVFIINPLLCYKGRDKEAVEFIIGLFEMEKAQRMEK